MVSCTSCTSVIASSTLPRLSVKTNCKTLACRCIECKPHPDHPVKPWLLSVDWVEVVEGQLPTLMLYNFNLPYWMINSKFQDSEEHQIMALQRQSEIGGRLEQCEMADMAGGKHADWLESFRRCRRRSRWGVLKTREVSPTKIAVTLLIANSWTIRTKYLIAVWHKQHNKFNSLLLPLHIGNPRLHN